MLILFSPTLADSERSSAAAIILGSITLYSTRTTSKLNTKTYNPSAGMLAGIPFHSLVRDYETLNTQFSSDLARRKKEYQTKLELDVLTNHTGEDSYEGDFSEFSHEEKIRAKFKDANIKEEVAELVTKYAKEWNIQKNASWFFPQMIARFSKLPLKKNESGLYSAKFLFVEHIRPDPVLVGMWLICRQKQRSVFVKGQTETLMKNFSSLVPLIMSAFKQYHNVGYEEWDSTEISGIVEPNLLEVMQLTELPDVTKEEMLAIRDLGLTNRTTGEVRDPRSSYTLYLPPTVITHLPMLAKIMMCQTWCAHPSVRTPLMVLNPLDWDNMPDPLVEEQIVLKKHEDTDMDWAK